jgi:two-component SAPR family response regulator
MIPIGDIKEEYPEIDYTDLEGGLACIKLLAEHESTSKIPIIIISARSFSMIKSEINKFKQVISYFSKPIGPEAFDRIIEIIHSSLSLSGKSRKRKSETAMKKFMASIEAKPGAFGVKVDLKKLLIKEKKANIFLHQTGVSLPLHTYR